MKTIGIIGAVEEEIFELKSKMEVVAVKKMIGSEFYIGKMHGKSVVLVRSGVGKVNAAICAQVLIDLYAVDYIVNTGVAGALAPELTIGDVVISEDCVQHDFDLELADIPRGVIPKMPDSFFKADDELVRLAQAAARTVLGDEKVHAGRIATGDQFIASGEAKNFIRDTFQALCTEMEGAAIAQTCVLNKIPFVIIRSISDQADENAASSFGEFFRDTAKNSGDITELIIKDA
jgi:adenosylhomocysteine nucleosidase